ncbi:MAG: glycoside hydrolase family 2 TIM barrel-domain containing protein [Bacteroidota bacterium]
MRYFLIIVFLSFKQFAFSQTDIIQSINNRDQQLLNGNWKYIIDPYETGYRNHRNWTPFDVKDYGKASAKPYWTNKQMENPSDRIEYNFDRSDELSVPGDWNSQKRELLYYEGTLWYKTDFDADLKEGTRHFLYFDGVNYETDVYLNGEKIGRHEGGFDPFNFEVTGKLKNKDNFLIVRVDNKREKDNVPNLTTDWWNYGGITRDVRLVSVPETFITDYHIQLDRNNPNEVKGYVKLDGDSPSQKVQISIPEAGIKTNAQTDENGYATFAFSAKKLKKWYPKRPKLNKVIVESETDRVADKIGFRTIETKGEEILLNGTPIFLRGISLHEEVPQRAGRAYSKADAEMLFGWAKELNCNFVRLAHYPHNENMPRTADEMGLLLWEEIPVYWGIDYENEVAYNAAVSQLKGLVHRDKNRASVIVWSVANETPETEARLKFLQALRKTALDIDPNRLISAALERDETPGKKEMVIPDPFAADVDLLSCNEYIGWYGTLPEECSEVTWNLSSFNKPFFVSEFGGGALYGYHGDKLERWTEEYQEYLYEEQLKMLKKIPSLRGMTPWILADFRSPRRNLPDIQEGWNRKGVISDRGFKKKAFYVLKSFYDEMEKKYDFKIKD